MGHDLELVTPAGTLVVSVRDHDVTLTLVVADATTIPLRIDHDAAYWLRDYLTHMLPTRPEGRW